MKDSRPNDKKQIVGQGEYLTGQECERLYHNADLKAYIWEATRRYTKCQETREQYFQEAWLKTWAKAEGSNRPLEYYLQIARRAIEAAYRRQLYKKKRGEKKGLQSERIG